ncbi:MAG: excinuclease ABC subunit UvrA [Candidatus Gracilibacteria bacterium]|nr:excinuclease ABC subunit UvrA [Candidatus Gracilibacteria bacterium]
MSENIEIIGARTHNLKNVSVTIPKNSLVVMTGVSGSGKSSLAFDTLYAEGQKRYLESLSTYARMIVSEGSNETRVDEIRGLSPTIAINQKTVSNNPRSTVGTITEIYDYYRLLYTTIGKSYCPNHPHILLKKHTLRDVVDTLSKYVEGEKIHICIPIDSHREFSTLSEVSKYVADIGFVRFQIGDIIYSVADTFADEKYIDSGYIVIDRLVVKTEEEEKPFFDTRFKDSVSLAFQKGEGRMSLYSLDKKERIDFFEQASCPICNFSVENLSISNFSFNSHHGACPDCHGLGSYTTFREEDIVNPRLSLAEGALLPWSAHPYYIAVLEAVCEKHNIDIHAMYGDLSKKDREKILYGVPGTFELSYVSKIDEERTHKSKYEGLIPNLERRYRESDLANDAFFKRISQFATEQICRTCGGFRLKKEYLSVLVGGKNIGELTSLSVEQSRTFFDTLSFTKEEKQIVEGILKNITERLEFLSGVGLDYVTLARRANTLSGGESQRIRLATQIGTRLEGIIYVLDEPSIGLHPRDNEMLIKNLKRLARIGNSVIVVEHDEDIMQESDYIIDIGPHAGVHGGEVIFSGTYSEILSDKNSETGQYLAGKKHILRQHFVNKKPSEFISILGAEENNLKNINVRIPLQCLTVVTGVSGSGKSSLIVDILSNKIMEHFHGSAVTIGKHRSIEGLENIDKAIIIDQSPIGKTPHSNIATYTGVFTYIREVFAASHDAQKRGYGPGRFSFNTKGGRCDVCEGSGVKKIEMHFLPDVYVECETCSGTRYNAETLDVKFKGKNIAEVLDMTIDEAVGFFVAFPRIARVLDVLQDVGLGYIKLGQSAPTLSGGEAQRIKLAFDLAKRSTGKTLYILDEPTTGLHFSDVQKLLDILDKLVGKGNSVIVIEHNLDIIANADAIIDIGPEGGDRGGNLVFAGPREKLLDVEESYTARALKKYMKQKK